MKHIKTEKDIIIIGLGFVGQANALALLKKGFNVYGVDIKKIQNIYKNRDFNKIKILKSINLVKCNQNFKFTCPVLVCVNAPTISKKPFQEVTSVKIAVKTGKQLSSGPIILRTTLLPMVFPPNLRQPNRDFLRRLLVGN